MTQKELLEQGGKVVCHIGLQNRPVVELDGDLYEQAIYFGGEGPLEMYKVEHPEHLRFLRAMIDKEKNENIC